MLGGVRDAQGSIDLVNSEHWRNFSQCLFLDLVRAKCNSLVEDPFVNFGPLQAGQSHSLVTKLASYLEVDVLEKLVKNLGLPLVLAEHLGSDPLNFLR